jgi:SAM-dependent methyltransferase
MDDRLMKTMLAVDEHHWWYRGRRAIISGELERLALIPGAPVLDAGCGSGRTLIQLAGYGAVSGIELSEAAAAVARERGPFDVRIGRLEQLPWPDGTFGLITCLDVVEHTPDDVLTLRELRRVSRPGAWLLVTVPAYQRLWSRHDVVNHHYRRYSRRTLAAAASAAGWQIERMTSFNSLLLAPAAAVRLAQRRRPADAEHQADLQLGPAWLNSVLERPLQAEARWLARGRTLPAGLSLLATMRNPVSAAAPQLAQGAAAGS